MAAAARHGTMPRKLSWPFVGRDDELEYLEAARRESACCGVVIIGAAGVGKTRLAREVLAAVAAEGSATEWVQATRAAASIPLGAFAGLVPAGTRTDDRLQLFQVCAESLHERAGLQRVVLGVDDAHLLDATSAALVLHVASSGTAFVVVTIRAGERCPDSIVALWKDLDAPRLDLQQLSEDETGELLDGVLEGEVATGVKHWAFASSEGHVLYLRELVKGALANGALVEEHGLWTLRTQPAMSPALVDLISGSLDGLSEQELDVVRALALGEPLDVDTITDIASRDALSTLEEAGLTVVTRRAPPKERIEVRLGHPIYGEVVRASLPTLHGNELRARLAEDLRARGLERPGDALRAAGWLEDSGVAIDEPLALAAARDANAAGDPALAERFALRLQPGPERAVILGTSYALRRRFGEAEEVLAGIEGAPSTRELAALYLEWRATRVLHVGLSRTSDALAVLDRAEGWFPDQAWRDQVDLLRDDLLVNITGPARVLDVSDRRVEQDDPEVRRRASIQRAATLYFAGRTAEAYALSQQMRPSLPPHGEVDAHALMTWSAVRAVGGYDWDELERWLLEAERATERGDLVMRGMIQHRLAAVALRRGKPATGTRRAHESVEHLESADPFRELPLACSYVVMGAAMQRDIAAARAALDAYEAALGDTPVPPSMWRPEATARGMLLVAEGETSRAIATLLEAVEAREGYPLDEALLLHEAFRAGAAPQSLVAALDRAAGGSDAPLPAALAQLVAAAAANDGKALTESTKALANIGAWLWAAESSALAAVSYTEAGLDDSARRATAHSRRLLEECEDIWSPVLAAVQLAPAELTRREQEIVSLAAMGASNAEIAERLVLSIRTVESHLYRAMRKLGIDTRQELANS